MESKFFDWFQLHQIFVRVLIMSSNFVPTPDLRCIFQEIDVPAQFVDDSTLLCNVPMRRPDGWSIDDRKHAVNYRTGNKTWHEGQNISLHVTQLRP